MEEKDYLEEEGYYKIHKPMTKEEKANILKELSRDCEFFKNVELPFDLKIDIMEIKERIAIPSKELNFFLILKEGNVFLWIGKTEEIIKYESGDHLGEGHLKVEDLEEGKIVEILDEGEVLYACNFETLNGIPCLSPIWGPAYAIAGLPREKNIETVKMIRIPYNEFAKHILNNEKSRRIIYENVAKILHQKLEVKSWMLNNQIDTKASIKIFSTLYGCFSGWFPLGWYKIADGEIIDNANRLKRPKTVISSFNITTQEITWLTGLSQPTIDELLTLGKISLNRKIPKLFKKYNVLKDLIKVEKIHGGYQFSLSMSHPMEDSTHCEHCTFRHIDEQFKKILLNK